LKLDVQRNTFSDAMLVS